MIKRIKRFLGIGEKRPDIVFFFDEEGLKVQEWLLVNQPKIKECLMKLGIETIDE